MIQKESSKLVEESLNLDGNSVVLFLIAIISYYHMFASHTSYLTLVMD
jgi:hypothetical protein